MNWLDYRKALGIGFEDEDKEQLFLNRLSILCDLLTNGGYTYSYCEEIVCGLYFVEIYKKPIYGYYWDSVNMSWQSENSFLEALSKAVVLVNCFYKADQEESGVFVEKYILSTLDDLKIPYEIIRDGKEMFIFPKGAAELDKMNVSVPFEWLSDYPQARQAMKRALESYSNNNNYSETADLLRKALECFMQTFFDSKKSLENLKSEYGQFMKEHGVPNELASNFETVLQMYTNYMNNFAKHHNKTEKRYLEFIMYHTGNIIRFMISLTKQDA